MRLAITLGLIFTLNAAEQRFVYPLPSESVVLVTKDITICRSEFMKASATASIQREVTNGVTEAAGAAAVKSYEVLAASRAGDTEFHRNFGNALLGAGEYRRAKEVPK